MTKTTIHDYREAIVEAVAELDRCDGSRIGQSEAIDSARTVLQTAYGDTLDQDVQNFIDESEEEGGGDSRQEDSEV
jgi:hypothetical protein